MSCAHWTDCGRKNAGCCAIGKHGGKPSLGLCKRCPDNTAAPVWPSINLCQLTPTADEQAAWLAAALPHCQACPAFGGVEDRPAMHIKARIRCADCKSCGSKTVGPLQDCPREHFERWKAPARG